MADGRWIFVGRARAMAHPQAKLNAWLVLSALYFAVLAALQIAGWIGGGVFQVLMALPILNLITAVAIILRWPFAHPLTIAMIGLQIGAVFLIGWFGPDPILSSFVVAGLAVGLYFAEGGRPNLIYRHRYWSTKPREDSDV